MTENLTSKYLTYLGRFLSLNLSFLIILILLRFYEYIYITTIHSLLEGSFALTLTGLVYDLYLFLLVSAALVIPFLLLSYISNKAGVIFYEIIVLIILIVYMSLMHYFIIQQIPLGKDLFGYTTAEIRMTVLASGQLNVITFIPFVLSLIIFFILTRITRDWVFNRFILIVYYVLAALCAVALYIKPIQNICYLVPDAKDYKKDLDYYLVNNKLNYFVYDNIFKERNISKLQNTDIETQTFISKSQPIKTNLKTLNTERRTLSNNKSNSTYLSDEYPFLRLDDTKDVLGQFFNKSSQRPNVVIILVESLSAAFTGKEAYLGSFTPFLDSLIEHSLYWNNFLSTAGRTFGVTPAVLGSLPFDKHGFLDMGVNAPDHLSLMRLLKENGYYCSFYYGGDPHFDLMDEFYKREHIDFIIHQNDYGNGYIKFPPKSNGFSWGYADREIFRKSFEIMNSRSNTIKAQPRLDVYMTLATHDPFHIPNMDFYIKKFNERMHVLGITGTKKEIDYVKDKEKYACVLYLDDALKYFINQYKKRDDFKNTIFIITGDHRMAEIPIISKIDKFHVPLIIYSPLLKQSQHFESVSSHLDITPSMVAFLRDNYQMKFPPKCSWLGHGLDVDKSYRNIHSLAFMWEKNDMINFIDKHYFINENQLFKLGRNMDIEPINNDTIFRCVNAEFNKFKELNNYVCQNNKLYPDKNPDINAQIKILYDSQSSVEKHNASPDVILDKFILNDAFKNLYVLTSFKLLNPNSELIITITNSKSETIYTKTVKLTNQTKMINLKNLINLNGKNQDAGSYINILLNNKGAAKLNYDNLSVRIYGEK